MRAGAKDSRLGGEPRQPGGLRQPDPTRPDPAHGHYQRGGAPGQAMRDTKHEDGGALFRGDLQPKTERRRDGFPADKRQLAEIQRDESETRAAREEISRAEGCAQPPAALHPEQSREVDPGGNGGDGIECIRSIHEGDLIAGGRGSGHQGQEQTAAS